MVHQDIKPPNLGVVSLYPPRAMITDFGSAIEGTLSDHCEAGMEMYHAPEIWRLKRRTASQPLGKAVDMFAFGLGAYRLFCRQDKWWHPEAEAPVLMTIARRLMQRNGNVQLKNLIGSFHIADPQQRTTARQAKTYAGVLYEPGDQEGLAHDMPSLNMSGNQIQSPVHHPHGSGLLGSTAALLCVVATSHGGKGFIGYISSLHTTQ